MFRTLRPAEVARSSAHRGRACIQQHVRGGSRGGRTALRNLGCRPSRRSPVTRRPYPGDEGSQTTRDGVAAHRAYDPGVYGAPLVEGVAGGESMPVYEFYCRRCDKGFTAMMHVEEHER